MWSFVQKKENQRWLWHAIDRATGKVLAYVLGDRTDNVFLKLKTLLEPFGISKFSTDGWGAYERRLDFSEPFGNNSVDTAIKLETRSPPSCSPVFAQ